LSSSSAELGLPIFRVILFSNFCCQYFNRFLTILQVRQIWNSCSLQVHIAQVLYFYVCYFHKSFFQTNFHWNIA
jgi:hypothetical protein